MALQASLAIDNRDAQEMYGYLEARIDVLKRRIAELQKENHNLRVALSTESELDSSLSKSA
jgi:hypothetical protein